MNMKVRKAGDKDFTKDAKKYGVDVFEDDNNANILYLSESGSLAVVPKALVGKDGGGKAPEWQYGMEVSVRGAAEKDFGKDTKKYGIEVFKDASNGCMVYIAENGSIAVVPAKLAKFVEGKSKGPENKRAMNLAVRKVEETEFTDATKKLGVEVYLDENSGNLLYISETGNLAVVPPKEE